MEIIPTQRQVETAKEIDALLEEHKAWIDRLNKSLICRTSAAADMLEEDAHLHCPLGHWLEVRAGKLFSNDGQHQELRSRHKHIHDLARTMVMAANSGAMIEERTYEDFLVAASEFEKLIGTAYDSIIAAINATDPLTGAQNRSHMRALLEDRIAKIGSGLPSWILMIDLDHFKSINDRYGHEVGDRVLKGFSSVVRDHIRSSDLFFRYGGEEFLLCISDVGEDRIANVAERLRSAISRESYEAPDGTRFSTTASFGITRLSADHDVTSVINAADTAMYAAKRAGRNQVIFSPTSASEDLQKASIGAH
ncbi:diguanylate cyclase [Labrenzia sp. PHM005]|uniref:diguanylate cyclase n=1 Tax=Labrenzia sp. PHM005 TaxID=2590016 RepID=UPI00114026AD|nr:diguanylate cyclase [Labrenzia sp. PHM005]QDG76604.1 diguanylate cyclase [Labrenzia sp. PHM005]